MEQRFIDQAARAMRIIAAYDGRTPDEFEVQAIAMAMERNPKLLDEDYENAIVDYHQSPRNRIRAGNLIEGAKRAWERRTDARAITSTGEVTGVPRPKNYAAMVKAFQRIAHEFREQGIDPTNEDILKENARRVRAADAARREAS